MARPAPYVSAVSISLPSEEELGALIGDSYNGATMLNVFKMMAGTGNLYPAAIGFIKALFQTAGVDPGIREVIMLRAATILKSPYEWQANIILAKNVGLNQAEIEAVTSDLPILGANSEYALIVRATDELSMQATLTDKTLSELLARYGDVVSRKLILIIGWFNLWHAF